MWKAILNIYRLNYCARKSTNIFHTPIICVNTKAHFQYTIYIHRLIDCCFGILITIFHEYPIFLQIFPTSQRQWKFVGCFSFAYNHKARIYFSFVFIHKKLHLHLTFGLGFIFSNWGSSGNQNKQQHYKYVVELDFSVLSEKYKL